MPARVIVSVSPQTEGPRRDTGPLVHAAFLAAVNTTSPSLAERLHSIGGPSPYSLSPLIEPGQAVRDPQLGGWRIEVGLLVDELVPWVVDALDALPSLRLGKQTFQVDRIDIFDESYEALLEAAAPRTAWTWDLMTPTTSRLPREDDRPRRNQVLPLPDLLAFSLARRWEQFSRLPLAAIQPAIDHHLVVSRVDLRTKPHLLKAPALRTIGCVGRVEFRLLGEPEEGSARCLDALWRLGEYSGLGDHTTKGMGMALLGS